MAKFESEMSRARGMKIAEPDRLDYWTGYERGLRRAQYGDAFGTSEEHALWLSLVDDETEDRRQKGDGYAAGLVALSRGPGRPPQFEPSTQKSVRLNDADLEAIERAGLGLNAFVKAAVREKVERDGLNIQKS